MSDSWLISHAVAAVAYLLFGVLLTARRRGRGPGIWLILACVATSLWAGTVTYEVFGSGTPQTASFLLDGIRNALWLAFLASLLDPVLSAARGGKPLVVVALIASAACALLDSGAIGGVAAEWPLLLHLGIAMTGLVLIETLIRGADPDRLWSLKFLAAGLGLMFAYDLLLFSEALLFHRLNGNLGAARGALLVLIMPVLAISAARNKEWALDIGISRRAVFHSVSILGSGGFLIAMAAAGYYLQRFGGSWGTLLSVVFVAGSILLLLATLGSGRFRGALKLFIAMHFFSYKYDYRTEWLRFIETLSSSGPAGGDAADGTAGLRRRVIRAIADIFDSPGGAIWLATEHAGFHPAGAWNFPECGEIEPPGSPFVVTLEEHGGSVEIAALRCAEAPLPRFLLGLEQAWLIVPLTHRNRLTGFVVLLQPRAARALDWEDWDLLRTVGRQAASALAEHEAAQTIADTRQFDAFNRRFSFVAHDIKNLVSPLAMLLSNAERHGSNPDFQADLITTVQEFVEHMKQLLAELKAEPDRERSRSAVTLGTLLAAVGRAKSHPSLVVTVDPDCPAVLVDASAMQTALGHLVQNALDATQGLGQVGLHGSSAGGQAVIEIRDDGPGMSAEFIRDRLFRPFTSTKPTGYGIGVYQARALIHEQGGALRVDSAPGRGTTMWITLPPARTQRSPAAHNMETTAP